MSIDDSLKEKSRLLVGASHVGAVSAYGVLFKEYPDIGKIEPKHWDFILTIAGVFVAVSQLNHENVPEVTKEEILDLITIEVVDLYPDGPDACEDCRQFVDRPYDGLANRTEYKKNPQYLFSDSLGAWMVWNLYGHASSSEFERKLIRVLGIMTVHPFVSWWK